MVPLLALACTAQLTGSGGHVPTDGVPGTEPQPTPPDAPTLSVPAAFNPLFAPLVIEGTAPDGVEVRVEVGGWLDETVQAVDGTWTATWTGKAGADWAQAGTYTVRASVDDLQAEAETAVVRPGIHTAYLEGDGGIRAHRELLVWPIDGVLQAVDDPVATLSAIDDGEVPSTFEAVDVASTMAVRPAAGEPAAFTFDARPLLVLDVAADSPAIGPTGVDQVDVHLSVEGWTVLSGAPLRTDAPVLLQLDAPLGDTVGISELVLPLVYTVDGDPVSEQELPLAIYRVLGPSGFQNPDLIYKPWAPVVHQATMAIEGTPATHTQVADALVDWVYNDMGLVYDTVAGASAYSTYDGWSFGGPHFYLSDFLVRRYGNVINCSDAGNILGAYANMVGARLDHLTIDPNFGLNEIKAIGQPDYTSCPFGPWGCGFSYHAVTTNPGSGLVWDATLQLDGDADPGAGPYTELPVQSIDAQEYLDRLVRSGSPDYGNMAQETIE